MKGSRYFLCFFSLLLIFHSGADHAFSAEDLILARINEEALTLDDLARLFTDKHQGHTGMLASEALLRDFLFKVVDERLLIQEAYNLELDKIIERRETFVKFRKKLLKDDLYKEEVLDKAVITDEMVEEAYKRLDVLYRGRVITVHSEREAMEIHKKLQKGEDFEELARKNSLHKTARFGGDLGFVAFGILDEKVESALFALEEKTFSQPFETEAGWNIVFLQEKKNSTPPEYERVSDNLRAILKRRKMSALREGFYEKLYDQYGLSFREEMLEKDKFLKAVSAEKIKHFERIPIAIFKEGELMFGDFINGIDIQKIEAQDPFNVQQSLKNHLENKMDDILLDRLISERKLTHESERKLKSFKERLMMEDLYNNFIMKDIQISDREIEAYYKENGKEFEIPLSAKLRMISAGTREKMEAIKKKIMEGEEFSAVAAEFSEDRFTASRGGDMGWVQKGEMPEKIDELIFSMEPGDTSDILELPEGFGILKVEERKEPVIPVLSDVKEKIRKQLMKQKGETERAKWVSTLEQKSRIKIYERNVRKGARLFIHEFEEREKASPERGK
ncbi:MAG: peptidylprolyl isomerase [Acidobacteriota bacterium]